MAGKSVGSVLDKLKSKYKESFVDTMGNTELPGFYLDSPQLNFVFGGKFVTGRIYEFFGPESSGKSSFSTYIAIQNQLHNEERPMVLYLDIERTFDIEHALELGLDVSEDRFILMKPMTGEEAFQMIHEFITELPIGVVVWDSIGATASASQMDDAFKATYGGVANVLSSGLKFINPFLDKYNTSLIFVNQERALIGGFSPVPGATSTPGGFARKFYASSRNRVTMIEKIKDKSGSVIGIKCKFRNIKSKLGVPFREAIITLYYNSGVDSDSEYFDFIKELLVEKGGGGWYNREDWGLHIRGEENFRGWLEEHPDIYAQAKEDVKRLLAGETILDTGNDKSGMTEAELEEATEEEKSFADFAKKEDEFVEV